MYVIDLKGTHVLGHFYYGNEGRDKFSLCQQGQHPTPTLTQMRWMPCKRLIPYNRRRPKRRKNKNNHGRHFVTNPIIWSMALVDDHKVWAQRIQSEGNEQRSNLLTSSP